MRRGPPFRKGAPGPPAKTSLCEGGCLRQVGRMRSRWHLLLHYTQWSPALRLLYRHNRDVAPSVPRGRADGAKIPRVHTKEVHAGAVWNCAQRRGFFRIKKDRIALRSQFL